MSTPEGAVPGYRFAGPLAVALIGLCAPLYAVLTFDLDQNASIMRVLAVPVLATEWALIALAFLGGFRPLPAIRAVPRPVSWALGLWAVIATISALMAQERAPALIFLWLSITHALTAFALYNRFATNWQAHRKAALLALAAGIATFAAIAHLYALLGEGRPSFDWMLFGMGVSNVRHLGFYAVALAGLGMGMLAAARAEARWLPAAGIAAAGIYFAAWTGGRSPFLTIFVVAALVTAIMGSRGRWKVAGIIAVLIPLTMPLTILTAPDSEFYGLENILGRSTIEAEAKSPSVARRADMWSQTAAKIAERPFIGHGQNNWQSQVPASHNHNAHPHNAVMQVLFDWGIPGALALLVIAVMGLMRIPGWIAADRALALPALGALAALAAMSMTDGVLFFAFPQFVIAICVAILASIGVRGGERVAEANAP